MQSVPGYSGFRRDRDIEPVCEKPGDNSAVRDNKFARAGGSVVYSKRPETYSGTAKTTLAATTQYVKPHHYKVPDKRGVMADAESRLPKPVRFVGRSIAQATYTNYQAEARRVASVSMDEYKDAFVALDKDGSGAIDKTEMRPLLCAAYGHEPDDREVLAFIAFFDVNKDDKITWEEFADGLPKIVDFLQRTNKTGGKRHLAAPWALKEQKPVIGPGIVLSSQQVDVGDDGANPRDRELMKGTGMNSTTTDLYDGTSKTTQHLPGYGGYIPQAHRAVSTAQDQAQGSKKRDVFTAKTNLLLTVNDAPFGYTGHRPMAPEHMSLDRGASTTVLTEKASADQVVVDYWKARNAAAAK